MSCTNKKKGECAGKPKASAAKRSDRQGVPVSRVNYVQEMFKIPSIYKEIRHAQVARFETDIIASTLLNLSMLDADIQKAYEEMSGGDPDQGAPFVESGQGTFRLTGKPTTGKGSRAGGRRKLETEFITPKSEKVEMKEEGSLERRLSRLTI